MPNRMKIYVGTLYTIENEFDECVASIKKQTYKNYEHIIFRGLPNKEAHDTLFRDFLDRSGEFDLMVKVDADMVITRDDLFSKIVGKFQESVELHILSIAVHDWFSDRLVSGLNTYKNRIEWKNSREDLFVDVVGTDYFLYDDSCLAPAAKHCPNPSPFQAFHFGVHKGLKVIQVNRPSNSRAQWRMREHWENIQFTYKHFERIKDIRLGFAVLGAELALGGVFNPEHISYLNPYAREVFNSYGNLDLPAIERQIVRLKRRNWAWLPDRTRRAWLWYWHRDKRVSLYAIFMLLCDALFDLRAKQSNRPS